MDNSHNSNPKDQKKRKWRFSYWGGSLSTYQEHKITSNSSLSFPLAQAKVGSRLWVVDFEVHIGINRFLEMGLSRGVELEVTSIQPSGSMIIALKNKYMGIGANVTNVILVTNDPLNFCKFIEPHKITTYLRKMPVGALLRVVGYDKARQGYKGKLISLGLTPGTEFTLIDIPRWGYHIQIDLSGSILTLHQQEADALCVEEVMEGIN